MIDNIATAPAPGGQKDVIKIIDYFFKKTARGPLKMYTVKNSIDFLGTSMLLLEQPLQIVYKKCVSFLAEKTNIQGCSIAGQ